MSLIITVIGILFFIVFGFCLYFLRPILPEFACFYLGLHLPPKKKIFNGGTASGKCPRCDKYITRKINGEWS